MAAAACVAAFAAPASAAPSLVKVGDFSSPTFAGAPNGDTSRVFVTERAGRVRLVLDGAVQPTAFLDVTSTTNSGYQERGLLSLAFAPDYALSGHFYIYRTNLAGDNEIWEYTRSLADVNVADPGSGRLLLTISHPDAQNHNGGQLQFGPDGKLYVATGDGGGGGDQFHHAQDPASLLGKLFTLDVATGTPTIVSRGLRNPWRFSFDRTTGELVIGDVGQDKYEEIDVGLAANYGWPCREGLHAYGTDAGCAPPAVLASPVLEHAHTEGLCAIVGGYVVRDPGLPTLLGHYLYGDNCSQPLRVVDLADPATDATLDITVGGTSSFGEDGCGRILVVSLNGPVSRLIDGSLRPCDGDTNPQPAPTTAATVTPAPKFAPTSPRPVADRRACKLSVRVARARRQRLSLSLLSDEACRATVRAVGFKAVRVALRAGHRRRVTLKAAKPHTRVRFSVKAVDAAGNVRTLTRRARLR